MSRKTKTPPPIYERITDVAGRRAYGADVGRTRRRARIAFVGAGQHALSNLYPCIPRIDLIDLAAVCDLEAPRALEFLHAA